MKIDFEYAKESIIEYTKNSLDIDHNIMHSTTILNAEIDNLVPVADIWLSVKNFYAIKFNRISGVVDELYVPPKYFKKVFGYEHSKEKMIGDKFNYLRGLTDEFVCVSVDINDKKSILESYWHYDWKYEDYTNFDFGFKLSNMDKVKSTYKYGTEKFIPYRTMVKINKNSLNKHHSFTFDSDYEALPSSIKYTIEGMDKKYKKNISRIKYSENGNVYVELEKQRCL